VKHRSNMAVTGGNGKRLQVILRHIAYQIYFIFTKRLQCKGTEDIYNTLLVQQNLNLKEYTKKGIPFAI